MKRTLAGAGVAIILVSRAIAIAAPTLARPEDKVEKFKSEYEGLCKPTPVETRRIVTATCQAEEEYSKKVADDVHGRVASLVKDK